jgi:DHA1 family multidrug resistance protein-like MFS transporter
LVAAGTPKERLSFALGFISSSNFIGFSFGPFFGGFAAEFFGYRISFLIGGSILFLAFVLVLFFIKEPYSAEGGVDEKDEKEISDGRAGSPQNNGNISGEKEEFSLKSVFRGFLLVILLLVFLMRFIRSFAQPFFPLYVQEILGRLEGASMNTGIITGLAGLATALAGITLGRLGDKFDKIKLISIYLILGAVVALPLFFARSLFLFAVFLIATRYFLGGVEPLLLSVLGVNTPPGRRGVVFGIQTFAGSMGWFFAPMVGSSISIGLGIRYVFLFHCLGIAFAFFMVLLFRQGNAVKRAMKRLRTWR